MYSYNLIIKTGPIDEVDALVNRTLTRVFGPDVLYYFHAKLDQEAVVVVSAQSKRHLQTVLGNWFIENNRDEAPYPAGTLLHYREILCDEPSHYVNNPLRFQLGG